MRERPKTVFEKAIEAASAKKITQEALVWTLAASVLYVPSGVDVGNDLSNLQPLLFDFEGASMLAVFTASDLVGDLADQAAYLVAIPGSEIVDILPPGTGLAVNPRNDLGFMLPPDAVAALRDALSGR